ncbi:hypothetical protein P5P86_12645 [Nocardioides sp. BP30]|uniref:hypothetical protein n=1 Tax=Nocardioides sp. BP30 TaxID=3036374 RepID=UPI0024690254|nr:hypothetical protein [Nocardioides sp. BP30]WGL50813.1 hypothetical protein P5P86_12645 [Nocardioides sp. BP30]
MAYVLLYGLGWTQRWEIAQDGLAAVENEISRVGQDATGHLAIVDPGSQLPTTLVVAWRHIAAAVVLGSEESAEAPDPGGRYR